LRLFFSIFSNTTFWTYVVYDFDGSIACDLYWLKEKTNNRKRTPVKEKQGELEFTLERYPCINKNFWWSRFFLIRFDCRKIWKMDQNEVTKHFSVGNTFRQASTMQMTWIRPSGGLRFGGALYKIFGGPLSYVEHVKIF